MRFAWNIGHLLSTYQHNTRGKYASFVENIKSLKFRQHQNLMRSTFSLYQPLNSQLEETIVAKVIKIDNCN